MLTWNMGSAKYGQSVARCIRAHRLATIDDESSDSIRNNNSEKKNHETKQKRNKNTEEKLQNARSPLTSRMSYFVYSLCYFSNFSTPAILFDSPICIKHWNVCHTHTSPMALNSHKNLKTNFPFFTRKRIKYFLLFFFFLHTKCN